MLDTKGACLREDTAKILLYLKNIWQYEIKLLNTHDPILRSVFKDKSFKSRGALYLLSEIWRLRARGVSLKDIEELLREFWKSRQDLVSGSIDYLKATGYAEKSAGGDFKYVKKEIRHKLNF